MMNDLGKSIFVLALLFALTGCELFDDDDNNNNPTSTPDPDDPSAPVAETYNVTVESVDMVNIDSGQPIMVDGFPLQGGELMVE